MEHKIKTFEEACTALGLNPETVLPDVSGMPENHRTAILSHAKLVIINQALNDDWRPDWNNGNWDKFYPWFYMKSEKGSSSPGFSFDDCDNVSSGSTVGSRLCYRSKELAEYVGKQFIDLYRDYMVIE